MFFLYNWLQDVPENPVTVSAKCAETIRRNSKLAPDGTILKIDKIDALMQEAFEQVAMLIWYNKTSNEIMDDGWGAGGDICGNCRKQTEGCRCRKIQRIINEVYGDMICGRHPCAYVTNYSASLEEECDFCDYNLTLDGSLLDYLFDTKKILGAIFINVRLEGTSLHVVRVPKQKITPIVFKGEKTVAIGTTEVALRPWSMALYELFVRHPEGIVLNQIYTDYRKEFTRLYHNATRSDLKVAKLKALFDKADDIQRTINDKVSELNKQLQGSRIAEIYQVHAERPKSNNKPYYIRHLHNHLDELQK